jgi:hypothetical protein
MTLDIFYQKIHCDKKIFCSTCRSDRNWRSSIAEAYTSPSGLVDWECPLGVPWPENYETNNDTTVHYGDKDFATITSGPGSKLAEMIRAVTGEKPCAACLERAKQMNEWGWMGCIRNAKTIYGWLKEEQEKRGIKIDKKLIWKTIKVALRNK